MTSEPKDIGAASTVLGVDVGGTKTAVVEGTKRGEILQRHEVPTEGRLPFDEAFARVAELLRRKRRTRAVESRP